MADGTPQDYRAAVARARQAMLAVDSAMARRLTDDLTAFADTVAGAARPPLSVRTQQAIRDAAAELRQKLDEAIAAGRSVTFDEVAGIWRKATQKIAADLSTPNRLTGGAVVPALTEAQAFEALGAGATWRSLIAGYVEDAAGEAQAIVRQAILARVGPDELAMRLRRYVVGAEPYQRVFGPDERFDLRQIPARYRGAAGQMRYNAERIAFSEIHNARGEAETQHFLGDPLVVSVRWTLSPFRGTQTEPDACDILAWGDFYGLGRGIYPLRKVPAFPHPFDRCELMPVVDREAQLDGSGKPDPERQLSAFAVVPPGAGVLSPRALLRAQEQAEWALGAMRAAVTA